METKNPLLPSTSFRISQSHENDQLEPRIEDSNNPGFPVINYPSLLNPFVPEYVVLSTPKNAEPTSLRIMQCKQLTPNSLELNFDQSVTSPNPTTGDFVEWLHTGVIAATRTTNFQRRSLTLSFMAKIL